MLPSYLSAKIGNAMATNFTRTGCPVYTVQVALNKYVTILNDTVRLIYHIPKTFLIIGEYHNEKDNGDIKTLAKQCTDL